MRFQSLGATFGLALLSSSVNALGPAQPTVTVYEYSCETDGSSGPLHADLGAIMPVVAPTATFLPGTISTLLPGLHPDHDAHDIQHLAPCESGQIFYGGHPTPIGEPGQFCNIVVNFTLNAVILDNSAHISSIACAAADEDASHTQMTISFENDAAYNFAKDQWTKIDDLALVSAVAGCGNNGQQRNFWKVISLKFEESCKCVVAIVIEVDIRDVASDLDIDFGNLIPGKNTTVPVVTNGTNGGVQPTPAPTCGTPPSPLIDGFPAAACGENFDKTLDDAIGYLPFDPENDDASFNEFIPGLDDSPDDYESEDGDFAKRSLRSYGLGKRGKLGKRWSPFGFIKKIAGPIYNAAKGALTKLPLGIGKVLDAGFKVAENIIDHPFTPSVEKVINVDVGPKDLVESPFGQAKELYKYSKANTAGTASGSLVVYCVDCGFKAKIDIQGKITVSLISGLTAGSIGMKGNVHAGLGVGLDAQLEYKDTFTKPISSAGLPGFSVPNVITVGPLVSLSAEMTLEAKAQGQLLAKIAMDVKAFDASLDLLDSSKSYAKGFTPEFTKTVTASGQIDLSADFGLPLKVGVGIVIPLIKFDKSVAIIERPGIKATAAFVGSTDPSQLEGVACPNGVSYDLSLTNNISLDFLGLKTVELFPWSTSLAKDCIILVVPPATSPPATGGGEGEGEGSGTTPPATGGEGEGSGTVPPATGGEGEGEGSTTPPTTGGESSGSETVPPSTGIEGEGAEGSEVVAAIPRRAVLPRQTNSTAPTNGTDVYDADPDSPIQNEGVQYISIVETSSQYQLSAADDGNFYLDNVGFDANLFVYYSNVTASDNAGRLFFFYDDVMAKYGVSRFRLAYQDELPKTSQLAALASLDYDDADATKPVLVVTDVSGNYYFTVVCNIDGDYSQIFLVNGDIEAGIKKLESDDLKWTVTGGIVSDCEYIPFTPSAPAAAPAA